MKDMKELCQEEIEDIRKNPWRYSWWQLCYNYLLTENFITEFQFLVDWELISLFQNLSKEFIIEFIDRIDFYYIIDNENISQEIKDYCRMFL
jgi:hypothetical protein